jgi:hypothetical protein
MQSCHAAAPSFLGSLSAHPIDVSLLTCALVFFFWFVIGA